jgi:hypothetical protein
MNQCFWAFILLSFTICNAVTISPSIRKGNLWKYSISSFQEIDLEPPFYTFSHGNRKIIIDSVETRKDTTVLIVTKLDSIIQGHSNGANPIDSTNSITDSSYTIYIAKDTVKCSNYILAALFHKYQLVKYDSSSGMYGINHNYSKELKVVINQDTLNGLCFGYIHVNIGTHFPSQSDSTVFIDSIGLYYWNSEGMQLVSFNSNSIVISSTDISSVSKMNHSCQTGINQLQHSNFSNRKIDLLGRFKNRYQSQELFIISSQLSKKHIQLNRP